MTGKQGSSATQEPCPPAPTAPRLLLIDAAPGPRRALAGHLAVHLGAPGARPAITESLSVEAALALAPGPDSDSGGGGGSAPAWDAALVSAGDTADGCAAVARLRAVAPTLPVLLMLPAGHAAAPWPEGVGCVDRPARLGTLVARLRALLADAETADAPPADTAPAESTGAFGLGPYLCDPGSRTLTDRGTGRTLALTEKEAAILAQLHAAGGPVGRDALLAGVWGYAAGLTTHTLETHIHRLRRKIEPDPRQPTLLRTDEGGYRLGG
ncbi:winged helix-turn-helix domain-containing protein [Roseospira goensis]|uniref:DNA-binding response OmpR family regulator n=1 Tax=Roseospira goensis TaxID=391922 RepID=A0A7W6RZH3_9PROT|nr:winged helix-turn-helix domain-containing protein [Roseospira goensis]MBB4285580.1 DNA-binding response OmpR family regulator [Roseospira goensis]